MELWNVGWFGILFLYSEAAESEPANFLPPWSWNWMEKKRARKHWQCGRKRRESCERRTISKLQNFLSEFTVLYFIRFWTKGDLLYCYFVNLLLCERELATLTFLLDNFGRNLTN